MRIDSSSPSRLFSPTELERSNAAPTGVPAPVMLDRPKVKDAFDLQQPALRSASLLGSFGGILDKVGGIGGTGDSTVTPVALPQAALDLLPEMDRARVQRIATGGEGAPSHTHLATLAQSVGFQSMSPEIQAKTLKTFLGAPPHFEHTTQQLTSLVGSKNYAALSSQDQARVLDIFQNTWGAGRENLVNLTNRSMTGISFADGIFKPKIVQYSALLDKDKDGNTLLDNLHAMATGPLAPALEANGITRSALLSSVMEEAGMPGEINQSNRGTCTVTSMQHMLCENDPAEYVRIMRGLTSPEGTVQLRNGATLRREEDSVAPDSATDRSASERMFQSAMMEYSNGNLDYSNLTDKNTGKKPGFLWFKKDVSHSGLYADQQERGIEALFGRNFNVVSGNAGISELQQRSGQELLINMKWGDGAHAVTFEKIENGRVYFRNPWGPTGAPEGTTYDNPPRRLEDGATRLESMSMEDFQKVFHRVFIPG
jgi:hypothetical protein